MCKYVYAHTCHSRREGSVFSYLHSDHQTWWQVLLLSDLAGPYVVALYFLDAVWWAVLLPWWEALEKWRLALASYSCHTSLYRWARQLDAGTAQKTVTGAWHGALQVQSLDSATPALTAPRHWGHLLKATDVKWTELLTFCLSAPEVASRAVIRYHSCCLLSHIHSTSFGHASEVSLKLTGVELMPFPEAMLLRLDHNQPTSGKVWNTSLPWLTGKKKEQEALLPVRTEDFS